MKRYETAAAKLTADSAGDRAELYVTYNSYELIGRYVGVEQVGLYMPKSGGDAEAALYTQNYDMKTEKLLALADVIPLSNMSAIGTLLAEEMLTQGSALLGGAKQATSEQMQNFVITEEGLRFLFADGAVIHAFTLTYDVIGEYLTLFGASGKTPTPAPTAAVKPAIVEEAFVMKNGVHIRNAADSDAAILASVQQGAVLDVTDIDAGNGWTQVWYIDNVGYVLTRYLLFAAQPTAVQQPVVTEVGYTTVNGVHVRADASLSSRKLATLNARTEVQIVCAYYVDGWHQILFDGQIAYIAAQYVQIGSAPAVTPAPKKVNAQIIDGPPYIAFVGTCTTNGVIIRSDTSIHVDYYDKLYNGSEVQVMAEEYRQGWDQVWIPTNVYNTRGYIGYVHSKYIEDWSQPVPVAQATPTPRLVPVVQATPTPRLVPVVQVTPTPTPHLVPVVQATPTPTPTPLPIVTSDPTVSLPHIVTGQTGHPPVFGGMINY